VEAASRGPPRIEEAVPDEDDGRTMVTGSPALSARPDRMAARMGSRASSATFGARGGLGETHSGSRHRRRGLYHAEATQEDFLVLAGRCSPCRRGRRAAAHRMGLRALPGAAQPVQCACSRAGVEAGNSTLWAVTSSLPFDVSGNASQRTATDMACSAGFAARRPATDCHWLRLLGSMNAPSP
jgi:hypothetical protein